MSANLSKTVSRSNMVRSNGRPVKFTAELQARCCELVALGLPLSKASSALGISFETLRQHRAANEEFRQGLERAVAGAIEKRLSIIQRAADLGDVEAAKWMLVHLHPEHFSRNRIEITGADGAPLSVGIGVYLPAKDGSPPIEVAAVTNGDEDDS